MKISIVGKNITITEGIKSALENKFSKFNKYFDRDDVSGRVVCRTYPIGMKLEITIFTPHMIFRAEAMDQDLYNAMDIAVNKLDGQFRKLKTRMDRRNKTSLAESIVLDNIESEKESHEDDEVVRTKSIYLEPMNIDEAITRMNAIDHDFFVYLDKDENRISVVYRRLDGGYGVIEAENNLK